MTQIAIETGVPLRQKMLQRERRYPMKDLIEAGPGASFLVPVDGDAEKRAVQSRLASLASHYHRTTKMRFTTRCVEDGVRIWRLA